MKLCTPSMCQPPALHLQMCGSSMLFLMLGSYHRACIASLNCSYTCAVEPQEPESPAPCQGHPSSVPIQQPKPTPSSLQGNEQHAHSPSPRHDPSFCTPARDRNDPSAPNTRPSPSTPTLSPSTPASSPPPSGNNDSIGKGPSSPLSTCVYVCCVHRERCDMRRVPAFPITLGLFLL